MNANTPQQFAARWQNTTLGERQSYQIHFMELCDLVGHERPTGEGVDSQGRRFGFESSIKKDAGGQGFADVFYEGLFAIEYKAPGKYNDLNDAYQQLLQYREKLNNPPLLIVTDIQNWEIHTNWPNTEKRIYKFTNAEIATKKSVENMLREMFITPERLHPNRNTEQVTTAAADVFRLIADDMRKEDALTPKSPLPQGARGLEDVSDSPSLYTERGLGGEVNVRGGEVKDRTLTNLYNALNVWRGKDKMKTKDAAADFAPRLDELHNALDQAVCDAYGWPHEILNDEEAILRNLLALNLERAALNGGGEA